MERKERNKEHINKNVIYEIPTSNRFSVLENYQEVVGDHDEVVDLNLTINKLAQNKSNRPLVSASSGNVKFDILLDSGSPVNLIDEETYNQYFSHIEIQSCSANISDIHSNRIVVIGCIYLDFMISHYKFHDSFYVVRNLKSHPIVLMGYPSCGLHNIRLLPDCQGILINKEFFVKHSHHNRVEKIKDVGENLDNDNINDICDKDNVEIMEKKENESLGAILKNNVIRSVVTNEPVVIASGEVRNISVRVSKAIKNNKEVMILPETVQIKGLSLECGLYVAKKKCN